MGRVASSLIYGVSSSDLATFAAVTALLIVVSFAASVVPAMRAMKVDPLAVLREE
jgi:putative ABC transport system permease protein